MRFQATAPAADGFERAASRASRFLLARGYRAVRGAATPRFVRGSLAGSVTGFSPRRWAVRVAVAQAPRGVEVLFQINATFQMVTEGERAFWADEAAGVLAAIEGAAPPPPPPTQGRTAVVLRVLGPILAGTVALGLIAGALGGLMRLALLVPGFERPPDFARDWDWVALLWDWAQVAIWKWMALGALFGTFLGLQGAAGDTESFSAAVTGAMPEGEALRPADSVRAIRARDEAGYSQGVVVLLDRDSPNQRAFAESVTAGWLSAETPVRLVVHPGAAHAVTAPALATRQLLVAGVVVDKSLLDVRSIQGPAGTAGSLVTQRSAHAGPAAAREVESAGSRRARLAMSIAGYTLKAVLGAAVAAVGGLCVWESIAVGRALGPVDTSRVLSLHVEHKTYVGVPSEYEMRSFYGRKDLRLRGRLVETNEPAEVAVEQADFNAAVPGQRLDVYRLRGAAPEYVARSKYKKASPLLRIPGVEMGFHWALLVGGFLIVLGVQLALERSVDDADTGRRG
jgi:hypothetical protein